MVEKPLAVILGHVEKMIALEVAKRASKTGRTVIWDEFFTIKP